MGSKNLVVGKKQTQIFCGFSERTGENGEKKTGPFAFPFLPYHCCLYDPLIHNHEISGRRLVPFEGTFKRL